MAPALSLFLYLLLAHTCLLLGVLARVLVLVPLELVGRGPLRLLCGDRRAGGLVLMGLWIGLVTVFAVVGALALDDLPHPAFALMAILAALIGVDGNYTVRSPLLLWVTRIVGIVLLAPILAAWAATLRADEAD
ncbi:hypothetical protein [Microlunatus sp. Y2014]|uniref:hypothetical protein n=1 Tax=Microlunatus sp. Y2014 TaxID=3418488 RepID=UPI003DA7404F